MPTAGHLGVEKTLEKVKESFYWPGMKDYIQDYCRQCDMLVYLFQFQLLPLYILCFHLRVAVFVFLLVLTRTV
jgi:hypothetical protein